MGFKSAVRLKVSGRECLSRNALPADHLQQSLMYVSESKGTVAGVGGAVNGPTHQNRWRMRSFLGRGRVIPAAQEPVLQSLTQALVVLGGETVVRVQLAPGRQQAVQLILL